MSELTEQQIARYARHVLLREIGGAGQQKLLTSKVLVIGAGGLGSPLLMYLAAMGVGTLGVIDDDVVDLSNLQRQIIHDSDRIGTPKVESAKAAIARINPEIKVDAHAARLTEANAAELISAYDLVADGSDNFATRYLVNRICVDTGTPLVSAALGQFEGQIATWAGYEPDLPCYACVFPKEPPAGTVPTCAEAGVIGALAGMMGSLQALEVIKELLGVGTSLRGKLMIYDALSARTRLLKTKPDPFCPVCGKPA